MERTPNRLGLLLMLEALWMRYPRFLPPGVVPHHLLGRGRKPQRRQKAVGKFQYEGRRKGEGAGL